MSDDLLNKLDAKFAPRIKAIQSSSNFDDVDNLRSELDRLRADNARLVVERDKWWKECEKFAEDHNNLISALKKANIALISLNRNDSDCGELFVEALDTISKALGGDK